MQKTVKAGLAESLRIWAMAAVVLLGNIAQVWFGFQESTIENKTNLILPWTPWRVTDSMPPFSTFQLKMPIHLAHSHMGIIPCENRNDVVACSKVDT